MSTQGKDISQEPMPPTNHSLKQDVKVKLHYLKDDPIYATQKPLQITPNFLDKEHKTNVRLAEGEEETIHDVRGRESDFSLDTHGFKYVHAPTNFKDWSSQPRIAQKYLPELEDLLRQEVEGCDEIIFYDARIRHSDDAGLRVEGLSYNPFAKQAHTDNTEKSVLMKIRNLTEMKADYLLSGRARIINIWRPIKHPVYDCGLAIADGGKLRKNDILECDRHRQDTGEFWDTMGVIKYRPGIHWYYMSLQDEPDVLLFKNYDSSTDVAARTCMHTAFDLPTETIPPRAPTRESIEVRALIFTYPEGGRRPSLGWKMPHPLAENLEQGNLQRVDIEDGSITDRVRTDIDEGNEIKDAVLILRRQEIRRLEAMKATLESERDGLADELRTSQQQIRILASQVDALQKCVSDLTVQLRQSAPELRNEVMRLEAQITDMRMYSPAASERSLMPDEYAILAQQLERANLEAERWKAEAMRRASEAVSRAWQGSVDEAVRREREKDAVIIESLRAEIKHLKV